MPMRRLLLALAASALLTTAVAADSAGAKPGSCARPASTKLVKSGGKGSIWKRTQKSGNVAYVACSTKYGKKVTVTTDDSATVDQIFHLVKKAVSTGQATLVTCTEYEDSIKQETAVANLKTGKKTAKVVDVDACPAD
jgi:hypothetical protein